MAILLRGNKVAVEKLKKAGGSTTSFLHIPDSEEYLGQIIHVGETADKGLKVGQKVYFSTNHQKCRMADKDLCVMDDKEIFAIVTE